MKSANVTLMYPTWLLHTPKMATTTKQKQRNIEEKNKENKQSKKLTS